MSATVTANFSANGYRLPTEAEWEYACRAGTTTGWSYGDTENSACMWYDVNSPTTTQPVGTRTANPWGLYDMHGNVWELCWDWYGTYTAGAQTDPTGASSGSFRVRRGGSWFSAALGTRSALRDYVTPGNQDAIIGFRLVRNE